MALSLVCLGIFLGTMDMSITNIALPTLAAEFDVASDEVIWVTLVFILVSTGLGLVMGRLGDLYGRKRLYILGFTLFTAAAGLAAIAGSLPELLGARAVQAVGASMVIANGAAIVAASFPAARRGQALGIMIGAVGAGVAVGPVLGGILVDVLDWRAIFWTRLPLGVIGAVLVTAFLRDMPADQRPKGIDLAGSVSFFFLMSTAVLAVNRGSAWGWCSWEIVGLFVGAVVLLAVFLRIEQRSPSPVLDLDLFQHRPFTGGMLATFFQFFGLSAAIILMPFYLVEGRGFSTLEAGGIIAGFPLAMMVFAPMSGQLSDRASPRAVAVVGLIIVAGGLFSLATLSPTTSVAGIVLRLVVVGTGTAIFSTPNTMVIMASVRPDRLGTASAAQTTARTVGNAFGIAVAVALFTSQATHYALARSPLGLDDPIIGPNALISGTRLAFVVAGAIAIFAIPPAFARARPDLAAAEEEAAESLSDRAGAGLTARAAGEAANEQGPAEGRGDLPETAALASQSPENRHL